MTSDVQRRKAMKRVRGTEALRWLRHVLKWLGLGAGVALLAGTASAWFLLALAWALASGGEAAIADLLATFRKELEVAMALSGVTTIGQIGPEVIDAT